MDMRDVILASAEQITHSMEVNKDVRVEGDFDSIILAGMGGSGHPGDLLNALRVTTVPLTVHRDYGLPEIYGTKPLVIVSSYSGNTEEALSAYEAAKEKGFGLLVNSSGGTLEEWSQRDNTPFVRIDYTGMQPRHTLFASFVGIATALQNSGLARDVAADLTRVAGVLEQAIPTLEEPAKQLAADLKGKTPVYASSSALEFAAKNFKIQTNENAKTPGFWNFFPELNHNEMVGFTQPQAKFHAVFIRSTSDHASVKARMDVTESLYKEWGLDVSNFEAKGETTLEQVFYTVCFGLWTTYYLALEYGIDPVPVDGVENFKAKLKEVAGA